MTAKPSYEELERQVHELKRDYTQLEKKLLESGSFTMDRGWKSPAYNGNASGHH
jgi:hypothetical protein